VLLDDYGRSIISSSELNNFFKDAQWFNSSEAQTIGPYKPSEISYSNWKKALEITGILDYDLINEFDSLYNTTKGLFVYNKTTK
jgi:hypothetical protein